MTINSTSWDTRLTLLERVRSRHDEAAWEEFISFYRNYIYSILNGMNIPQNCEDDLCQKILLKLWDKLPGFQFKRDVGKFRLWLSTVVKNQSRNFLRDLNAHKRSIERGSEEEYFQVPCDSELEAIAEREWNVYIARIAWKNVEAKMPDHYKAVFQLHASGKTTDEISLETSYSSNVIRVYLKRGRDILKAEIRRLTNELL